MNIRCPECGGEIEDGQACPRCLLNLGLVSSGDGEASTESPAQTALEHLPERFGAYHPVGVLGEGGMGIVYLAEQDRPIRRRVALKVIKQGMDTRHVIARFESERQALALMDHPNIAHVYDAGATPEGRPYFAMEYVPGIPITDYCDKHLLGLRERLELFIQVCHAVHHAHQKGVIHRDIKPSNVLVVVRDGKPVPKVIDFGVAKATHQRLTEKTLFTEFGVLIGTPAYMSPEQAEMTGLDVDTTTDIYALGVVLYELLVGALPFDPQALRAAGYEGVRRIIREDEPPTPTAKLHRLGHTATEIARRRRMDVRSLERFLRKDLDWIVMKALEKDRTRRYASASEFAADITRHLQDEVVVARPPSLAYRTNRFVRKHRGAVAVAVGVFVILALGFVVSTVFFFRSEAARREAASQQETAQRQAYLANIAAADSNLQAGAAAEAKRRLELIGSGLRGWEWRHLYLQADSSVATLGAAGSVRFVAISPDQSRVFWITEFGVAHVADARTRRAIPALTRPAAPVNTSSQPAYILAIAPDGLRMLSSGWTGLREFVTVDRTGRRVNLRPRRLPLSNDEAGTVSLTDALSGTLLRRFQVPNMGVWTYPVQSERGPRLSVTPRGVLRMLSMSGSGASVWATFSLDGRLLAIWGWDNVLRVWDVESGAPVAALEGHQDVISSAVFSRDGTRIVSGSHDGTARIWTLNGTATVLAGHEGGVTALAFAPDGRRVASAGADKLVRVWDISGHSVATLTGHGGEVTSVVFDPTGRTLASGSEDRTIRLWDAATFTANGLLNGHTDTITSIAFNADGRWMVSGSVDQTLRFWELAAGRSDGIIATTGGDVSQVAMSGDSSHVAVAQHDGAVRILNLSTMAPPLICTLVSNFAPTAIDHTNIAFAPDGSLVTTFDFFIGVWDSSNCNSLAEWYNDSWAAEGLAVSPDGSRFATVNLGGKLEVWDLSTRRRIWQTNQAGRVRALAYSPDGTRIIATAGHDLQLWHADRAEAVLTMTGHEDDVTAVAVSADGWWIASGSNDRTVRLWSATTGQPVATLTGPDAGVDAVAFSPDNTRLVSGGRDRALRLWDAATHEPILVLRGHQGSVTSVAFTPDGSRIVSGSADGTVRVWDSRLAHDIDAAVLAGRLRATLRFSTEMMDRVRADATLDPKVKTAALALIEARGDDPSALNEESRRAVRAAGLARDAYEIALRRALLANAAAPWNVEFIHTLGAAYYRLQRYEESLSTMTRAAGLRSEPNVDDLVFIAMAHHHLRHGPEAREALDRVRTMLTGGQGSSRLSTDTPLRALYDEATALIGR